MGGVAKHMNHLYDNPELTFGEIEDIFIKASQGNLVGTEKTDGQNLFVSYSVRDEEAKAARNMGNIKSGGMSASGLAKKFKGRGDLAKSFNDAFDIFSQAIDLLDIETQLDIFGPDANIWYNAEVQDPRTSNVISYDKKTLTIHRVGHKEFDKQSGKAIDKDVSGNAEVLEKALENVGDFLSDEEYKVEVNAIRNLEGIADDTVLNETLSRLYDLMSKSGMTASNTVGDYLNKRVGEVVDKLLPPLDPELKKELMKRIFRVPGSSLTKIYQMLPPESDELKNKIRNLVNGSGKIYSAAIWPLEDIVHDFSVEMLKGLESAFVLDNKAETENIKKRVKDAIATIEAADNKSEMATLMKQMKKLKDIENVSTAAEGFVFDYDGISYKFTGNFAPVNQILGISKYPSTRGGKTDLDEEEAGNTSDSEQGKADVALVPGSFKPPHKGHFKLMKDYLEEDANKVIILISNPSDPKNIRFVDLPSLGTRLEIRPDAAKRIFDLYIENAGLKGKIEVKPIWKKGHNNPLGFTHNYLDNIAKSGEDKSVVVGVSTKDSEDIARFDDMKEKYETPPSSNLKLINKPRDPDPSYSDIGATGFRKAVAKAIEKKDLSDVEKFIPDGVSAEAVMNIIAGASNSWLAENKVRTKEASSMASVAVAGSAAGNEYNNDESLIREEELEEMYIIDRKKFVEELILREGIRHILKTVKKKEFHQEQLAREAVKKMLSEEMKDAPYANTGINELEQLLKRIIPVIEPDYKSLTTSSEQRDSFRAHIINAVANALSPDITSSASDGIEIIDTPDEDEMALEEIDDANEEVEISVDTGNKFIDIDPDAKEEESPEDEEEEEFAIEGEDETGRNFAMGTWERIETNIVESYRKLSNPKDQDLFYDYLIANLKLYFDKFEDELANVVDEPESEIYDRESAASEDEAAMGAEEDFELGGEEAAI